MEIALADTRLLLYEVSVRGWMDDGYIKYIVAITTERSNLIIIETDVLCRIIGIAMPSQGFSLQDCSILLKIISRSIVDDIGMQTIASDTAEVSCCVLSGECNFADAGKIRGIPFAKPNHLLSLLGRNL